MGMADDFCHQTVRSWLGQLVVPQHRLLTQGQRQRFAPRAPLPPFQGFGDPSLPRLERVQGNP